MHYKYRETTNCRGLIHYTLLATTMLEDAETLLILCKHRLLPTGCNELDPYNSWFVIRVIVFLLQRFVDVGTRLWEGL